MKWREYTLRGEETRQWRTLSEFQLENPRRECYKVEWDLREKGGEGDGGGERKYGQREGRRRKETLKGSDGKQV